MPIAARSAPPTFHTPTQVAAEDSTSHFQHIFRRAIHALADAAEHENGIPLRWRGVGVGCYGRARQDPPLKAEAFFPLPRGDFQVLRLKRP